MSDSELPVELKKLKIAHAIPQIKIIDNQLPLSLNPFYQEGGVEDCSATNLLQLNAAALTRSQKHNSHVQNCRKCRPRRRSESTLDDFRDRTTVLSTDSSKATNCERPIPGVHRQTFKKTTATGNRKSIMRVPLLTALQTCSHVNNITHRKPDLIENKSAESSCLAANDARLVGKGTDDFRDLITECNNLLKPDTGLVSSRLNKLHLSQQSSKNFTIIQAPPANSRADRNKGKTAEADTKHKSQTSSSSNMENATVQRTNTTCSQQAGNSAPNVSDDVTIDELASYFDTLVHIPKKMSISAEMMYI